MIRHIGYERYFDFDAIFMTFPMKTAEEAKLKQELKAHVPFATGWHKKAWFKQSDLEVYLTERYPNIPNVHEKLSRVGIYPSVLHYAGREAILSLLEAGHRELAQAYNKLHYFPGNAEAMERIEVCKMRIRVLEGIISPEINRRMGLDDTWKYEHDYVEQLLNTYKNKAWAEKRFDSETTDMLRRKPERKNAS